jgi:hypothetical protein
MKSLSEHFKLKELKVDQYFVTTHLIIMHINTSRFFETLDNSLGHSHREKHKKTLKALLNVTD